MAQELVIRTAERGDAAVIAGFNIVVAAETEGKQLDEAVAAKGAVGLFDKPQYGFYIVAEKAGELVGSLMITYEWSDWRNGVYWWIQSAYVKPEFRGVGVFTAIYEYVRARAKEQAGVCGLRLYVEKENATAQRLYERLGMIEKSYKVYEESF